MITNNNMHVSKRLDTLGMRTGLDRKIGTKDVLFFYSDIKALILLRSCLIKLNEYCINECAPIPFYIKNDMWKNNK